MKKVGVLTACLTCFGLGGTCVVQPGNGNGNDNGNGNGEPITFTATLTGDQEVQDPPVVTEGSGTGTFTLEGNTLTFNIEATGLSGPVTAAHFHNGAAGVSGAVVFSIIEFVEEVDGEITVSGEWELSDDEREALLNGEIYVNLHTDSYPLGEIRGQLTVEE